MLKDDVNAQFEGYFYASPLWKDTLNGLSQWCLKEKQCPAITSYIPPALRLGKRVERFFNHELLMDDTITVILENHQIHDKKITLGELDVVITKDGQPIHIEIVYKFYVLDPTVGNSELEYCIGPNKRDSLLQKLHKLKHQQLPMLYHPKTQELLRSYTIDVKKVKQYVFFKAELFLPYKQHDISFSILNKDCINGYYIKPKDIEELSACKFFIPTKVNWLQKPHAQVSWMPYTSFKSNVTKVVTEKTSHLFWVKFLNGTIQKMIVVWWS